MKTGKKIAVCLAAALVVAIIAAGAVSMVGAQLPPVPINYTVNVSTPLGVSITIHETDFGDMSVGEERDIDAFSVSNTGDVNAVVEARFTTYENDIYGLTGGSVISADNFRLAGKALDSTGAAKMVCSVPVGMGIAVTARLFVPIGQPDAVYNGTVELIFSAA